MTKRKIEKKNLYLKKRKKLRKKQKKTFKIYIVVIEL